MNSIVEIKNLKKSFKNIKAVDDISFEVKQGEMFGLVGPDGAGKSTTIKILCGLLSADSGSVKVFDRDIKSDRKKIQNQSGYLSQQFSLYGDLSVDENIEFFADIHNVKNYKERRDELLSFTRLTKFRNRLAEKLSGGMKQKLALTCSLIHKPKIIFLDEPTTGVDPVSRRDFWKILSDLIKSGVTIFMSTPYLDEAERCNRVALMHKGVLLRVDTPERIKNSIKKKTVELFTENIRGTNKILRDNHFESQIFGDRISVLISDSLTDFEKVENIMNRNSIRIISSRITSPSLENVFIHLVKKAG